MKTKRVLSLLLSLCVVVSMATTLSISASAAKTDTNYVYVGEVFEVGEQISGDTTVSKEEQDGNLWYFYTTDEAILKVVDYHVEENMLYINLKGIAIGAGVEILCKQYDAENTSWVDGVSCVNGIYDVIPAPVYLDLDSTTSDIKDSHEVDQLYNASVTTNKTDVTKVQVSWTLTNISATVTYNKIWDTENLKWIDDTKNENTATADDVTAKFSFVNLSSVKVGAQVTFEAATGITAKATYTDNEEAADEGDGIIVLDTANTEEETYDNTGEILVNVPADTAYFKKLTSNVAAQTYGTYTVTIKPVHRVTVEYYASNDSTDEELISTTIEVAEGTAITVDSSNRCKITIGDTSFTTAKKHTFTQDGECTMDAWWKAILTPAPETVDEDMTISAIYVQHGC